MGCLGKSITVNKFLSKLSEAFADRNEKGYDAFININEKVCNIFSEIFEKA
jgi:hypothetical protein